MLVKLYYMHLLKNGGGKGRKGEEGSVQKLFCGVHSQDHAVFADGTTQNGL